MTAVAVRGAGIVPFGKHTETPLAELAARAITDALSAADVGIGEIDEIFVGNGLGTPSTVARVAQDLGIRRIPVTRIEQACASASTALRFGCEAIASGRRGTVLVLGMDKMQRGLLELDGNQYQARLGLSLLPTRYALKASQYLYHHGLGAEAIAAVSVEMKNNALDTPHAAYGGRFTVEDVLGSTPVADPLTLLQCCANVDGAAAAVLGPSVPGSDVVISGWACGSTIVDPELVERSGTDNLEWIVAELSRELYERTGLGPEDIDLLQINDAFSVAAPLYLEAMAFAQPGTGTELFRDGTIRRDGRLPVNTDGGLLGRGHCLGATGLAMLFELWIQLRGRAGDRQVVNRPRRALLQSHGLGGDNIFLLEASLGG